MKTKTTSLIAGSVLSAAVFAMLSINDTTPVPQDNAKPAVTKSERRTKTQDRPPALIEDDATHEESAAILYLPSADEESANLAGWKQRFQSLIAETADPEVAADQLRAEIDTELSAWVSTAIQPIAQLPPIERYDKLDIIERSVVEGAATILEALGLPGGRHVATASNALDLVAAEIQYAETAPDPESRLALLRLDRERQARLDEVIALSGEEERVMAESELEAWYSQGLAQVFPDDALTFVDP